MVFKRVNAKGDFYKSPRDLNEKNTYKFDSKNWCRFEMEKTAMMVKSTTNKDFKTVLLSNNKPTNYNKNIKVLYVNPRDVSFYSKFKELVQSK